MKPELKMGSKHVVDDTSWALVCDNEKSEPSSVRTGLSKTTTVTYHRCAAQAPFLGTAKRPIESPTPHTNDNNQLPGRWGWALACLGRPWERAQICYVTAANAVCIDGGRPVPGHTRVSA